MKLVALISSLLLLALAGCPSETRNESIKLSKKGAEALGRKEYETAVQHYKKALEKWPENHPAWYGLAGAWKGKQNWKEASDAAQRAAQLEPDIALYNLLCGVMLYEKEIDGARAAQAQAQNKKPEEITPDLSNLKFEMALQYLQTAAKLNNDIWTTHYYLGRIYRDTGRVKESAEEFTKALMAVPPDVEPWVALSELYRSWDYTEQALATAQQATVPGVLPDPTKAADIWYVLGMVYDEKVLHEKAIEAYSKSLDLRRDLHKAKFQRGQAYFRKGDYTNAKRDLEEFAKAGGASVAFEKQQATKLLADIAMKTATPTTPGAPAAPGEAGKKLSPEEMVKQGKDAAKGG